MHSCKRGTKTESEHTARSQEKPKETEIFAIDEIEALFTDADCQVEHALGNRLFLRESVPKRSGALSGRTSIEKTK